MNSTVHRNGYCLLHGGCRTGSFIRYPRGDLTSALDRYMKQSGVSLMYSSGAVKGVLTGGVRGDLEAPDALSRILSGTGFTIQRDASGCRGHRAGKIIGGPGDAAAACADYAFAKCR